MGSSAFSKLFRERLVQSFYNSKDSFEKLNNSKKYKYFTKVAVIGTGTLAAGAGGIAVVVSLIGYECVIAGASAAAGFGLLKVLT